MEAADALQVEEEREESPERWLRALLRLIPLPVSADGVAVVQGTRVYIETDAPSGLLAALLKLLERLEGRLRDVLQLPDPTDDDVGETHKHPPLTPTPTTQPIRRPRATPSLEPHRIPKPTGGTAVHRCSPQGTPSTQRLSAHPRSGVASGSRTNSLRGR